MNFVGVLFSKVLGFVATLLLTNALVEARYGIYAYVVEIIAVVSVFSQFGAKQSLIKCIPTIETEYRRAYSVLLSR